MIRLLLTLAVLALDLWAILSILGSSKRRRAKLGWIVLVVAVPVIGSIAWWRHERSIYSGGR
jgi:hypothetical protein